MTWEITQDRDQSWTVWSRGRVKAQFETTEEALAFIATEAPGMDVLIVDAWGVESVETAD